MNIYSRVTTKHFLTGPMSEKKCSSWYLLVSGGTLETWMVLQPPLSPALTVMAPDLSPYSDLELSSYVNVNQFLLMYKNK